MGIPSRAEPHSCSFPLAAAQVQLLRLIMLPSGLPWAVRAQHLQLGEVHPVRAGLVAPTGLPVSGCRRSSEGVWPAAATQAVKQAALALLLMQAGAHVAGALRRGWHR